MSTTIAPQSPPCATNFVVSEALHQHGPGTCNVGGVPPGGGRSSRVAVARYRRDHHVESVRCASAVRRGIGQRIDDLQLLDDGAGPSVRNDERQRVLVLRADVDEVDVEPVDLGDEVRQRLEPRLALAPVVLRRPIAARAPAVVASCTPCEASATVSRSGHRVALMRLRNSVSSASGTRSPETAESPLPPPRLRALSSQPPSQPVSTAVLKRGSRQYARR